MFAFPHHLAAFSLFAALVVELILIRDELTVGRARRLQVADMILGISAGVLLMVGSLRVYNFEKGAYYYFHTWTFLTKLTLLILVALVSIIPTREFLSWRKALIGRRLGPSLARRRRPPYYSRQQTRIEERRLDHADAGLRQHQRRDHHDRRGSRRHDP